MIDSFGKQTAGRGHGQRCSVCKHPQRAAINRAILAGQSHRAIAKKYGMGKQTVSRHWRVHLPETLMVDNALYIGDVLCREILAQVAIATRSIFEEADLRGHGIARIAGALCDIVELIEGSVFWADDSKEQLEALSERKGQWQEIREARSRLREVRGFLKNRDRAASKSQGEGSAPPETSQR
jgi:hypothetical protein